MTNLAKFIIEGSEGGVSPSSDRGYDAVHEETLAFRLEASASLVRSFAIQVYSASVPDSPLASSGAPQLTLVGATSGQSVLAVNPAADITTEMPETGVHFWLVRCLVDGGKDADGNDDPNRVFERGIAILTGSGLRKMVASESTQYEEAGWAEVVNRIVAAIDDIEVGPGVSESQVNTMINDALVAALGSPLPSNGVFPAPRPISAANSHAGSRIELGPRAGGWVSNEVANDGEVTLQFELGQFRRCKLTMQIDGTAEDGTAYELAVRILAHTVALAVTNISVYIIDHAIDGDVDAEWDEEVEANSPILVTAAPTAPELALPLHITITVKNQTGGLLSMAADVQYEERAVPSLPTP